VVQKHQARNLHYDLRLEMDGVLKSWAVPKGPSMNPKDKRLAMMVEDHPLEYADFEGEIPEGQYGAGKVEIWDKGAIEFLKDDLKGGHLTFLLAGKKLQGEFALVKIQRPRTKGGEPWLLIKAGDKFANKGK
jgi:bifunctional non-homologous end joining protein LigD